MRCTPASLLVVLVLGNACGDESPSELGRTDCRLPGTKPAPAKQILFGDLHVHSTHSFDTLAMNLPMLGGASIAGPARRCDFARFCSQLDFWSINDHPQESTAALWSEAIEAIRVCNDLEDGYQHAPNMVSFLGWEWSQADPVPSNNWGHKNVVFKDTCSDRIPTRPIAAPGGFGEVGIDQVGTLTKSAIQLDPVNRKHYNYVHDRAVAASEVEQCPQGVDTRELPSDCREVANNPAELYEKLDQWGLETLVIPHGSTWGAFNPPASSWRYQLNRTHHNPKYERLIEVYSGHGNGESFRPWRHVNDSDGSLSCPEPTAEFEPCCHRAGAIVRSSNRTCTSNPTSAECLQKVEDARQAYVDAGLDGANTLRGAKPDDWLDCGQCADCFQPPFNYRPTFSVQAALAMTGFESAEPLNYTFGFIGSTDAHMSGSGGGYKEFREMSDSIGSTKEEFDGLVDLVGNIIFREFERQESFYYSGGLVAVHADGRSREDIWEALDRRSVYATSGERMLVWFDHVDSEGKTTPMGSAIQQSTTPKFRARAIGALKQAPGCPKSIVDRAPAGFIERVCFGECYNPTDERYLIERIEVIKIVRQASADEPLDLLISDPFLSLPCPPTADGCEVEFVDPDYAKDKRPAAYYVRVLQEPTKQFNGATLRCTPDENGACVDINPCPGGYRGETDDCLASDNERAWASPIYLSP